MQFNETSEISISPIKRPQLLQANPRISKIKDSYYRKCENFCDDSISLVDTSKLNNLRGNGKFEVKIKSIIERRMNLQLPTSQRSHNLTAKQRTPEKKREVLQENTLNLTPLGDSLKAQKHRFDRLCIFTPNALKEIDNFARVHEKIEGNIERALVHEYAALFNENSELITHKTDQKTEEMSTITEEKPLIPTFRASEENTKLTENSLVIKETPKDDEKLRRELMSHLDSILCPHTPVNCSKENEPGSYNYGVNLLSNRKAPEEPISSSHSHSFIESCVKEAYIDGSVYYGTKANNMRHGTGVLLDKGQNVYIGGFYNGKKDGFGILKDRSGSIIYEGQWKNNKYHGKGRLANLDKKPSSRLFNYRNMDTIQEKWLNYEGDFRNGAYNGKGLLTIDCARRYEGEFKQGYVHGHGVVFDNGKTIEGDWRLNIYISSLIN